MKFLKNNEDIKSYCENILNQFPEWKSIFKVLFYHIYQNKQLKHCKICNNLIPFEIERDRIYCSKTCCTKDPEFHKQKSLSYKNRSSLFKDNVRSKIIKTQIEKYDGFGLASKYIFERYENTCIEKFGCKNPMQNKEIKEKAWKTSIKKYGCKNKSASDFYNKICINWKDYIIPLFSKNEYEGKNKVYKWKCVKCGNEFNQRIFTTHHLENEIDQYIPRCLKCFPSMKGKSQPENDLFNFCKEYFPNLIEHENKNVRTFIPNREIDILIPEIKLAIEFNGIKFHSLQGFKEKNKESEYHNYHLNKTIECEKLGYRLIHIWDDDWKNNKNNIKSKLIKIFKNEEELNFNDDFIKLDRTWYSKNQIINGYELIEETKPELIKIKKFNVENCGYLVYKKKV